MARNAYARIRALPTDTLRIVFSYEYTLGETRIRVIQNAVLVPFCTANPLEGQNNVPVTMLRTVHIDNPDTPQAKEEIRSHGRKTVCMHPEVFHHGVRITRAYWGIRNIHGDVLAESNNKRGIERRIKEFVRLCNGLAEDLL